MKDDVEMFAHTDYGRRLALEPNYLRSEIATLRTGIQTREMRREAAPPFSAKPGISIVVATHQGAARLVALLDSLVSQTLESDRFEVLIIENGDPDETEETISEYCDSYSSFQFRYFWRPEASAGGARNLGIQLARMSRITFVDDDDQLEPDYLRDALSVSTGNNLVISPIVNVSDIGRRDEKNPLNLRIGELRGRRADVTAIPWALGFNACKLVPTWMIRNIQYREDLRSGEDLVFWAQLLLRNTVEAVVAPGLKNNAYLRGQRDNSVSRRTLTRNFAVSQRLYCIRALDEIPVLPQSSAKTAVDSLTKAQAGFIARFLADNPGSSDDVIREIEMASIPVFPWTVVNRDKARDLAFVYCFAPFADTSAVVAAKALAERERVVDVVTNDMASVRKFDPAVSALADRWIDQRTIIDARPSFADWSLIGEFAEKAVEAAERSHTRKGGYQTMYSRALWVGSHVAAALFKLRHWEVEWTAEFSDPLRRDVEGEKRVGPIVDDSTSAELLQSLASNGYDTAAVDTLFDLVEMSTFVLADVIVFTNANQMNYMLSELHDDDLRRSVKSKSVVRQHPAPRRSAYFVRPTKYRTPPECVNIGYFGNFYANRGIGDVLLAIANSNSVVRRAVRLHVFSNSRDEVVRAAASLGVGANVYSNDYLPYMEFLNATTKFDVLLVNDVETSDLLSVNPFLPSKVSDYSGSGRPVWAIVDEGSPMSELEFQYRTEIGNVSRLVATLEEIVSSVLGGERGNGAASQVSIVS